MLGAVSSSDASQSRDSTLRVRLENSSAAMLRTAGLREFLEESAAHIMPSLLKGFEVRDSRFRSNIIFTTSATQRLPEPILTALSILRAHHLRHSIVSISHSILSSAETSNTYLHRQSASFSSSSSRSTSQARSSAIIALTMRLGQQHCN